MQKMVNMKSYSILFFLLMLSKFSFGQQKKSFDIFSYSEPAGFILKEQKQRLLYELREGSSFCQIHIWAAQQGSSDPAANFKTNNPDRKTKWLGGGNWCKPGINE